MEVLMEKLYIVYMTIRGEFWFRNDGSGELRLYKFFDGEKERMRKTLIPYNDVNNEVCVFVPFGIYETLNKLGLWDSRSNIAPGAPG